MKENFENDPFDEFEFKPLTEGLGFHKKPAQSEMGGFNLKNDFVEQKPEIPSVQEILRNLQREEIVKQEIEKAQKAAATIQPIVIP